MSYDLMVFEKTKVPNKKTEFMKWYEEQVEWKEDHNYDSIEELHLILRTDLWI